MACCILLTIITFITPILGPFTPGKRFLVVSNSFSSRKLYDRISFTKPFHNEPEIDRDSKKQICEDITGSYSFRRKGEYQYEKTVPIFIRWLENFNYRTTLIRVSAGGRNGKVKDEIVFVCLVRFGKLRFNQRMYYISEEYNVKTESNESDFNGHYIAGRFIFQLFRKEVRLYGLAETPGLVFTSPDLDNERLYLRRREINGVARSCDLDDLCRLEINDKQRICVAVFNSAYFEEEVTVSNAMRPDLAYACALEKVSFQTDYGKGVTAEHEFKGWMLDCVGDQDKNFRYKLSKARLPDQVFVYIRGETGDLYPENITTLVRLAVFSKYWSFRLHNAGLQANEILRSSSNRIPRNTSDLKEFIKKYLSYKLR